MYELKIYSNLCVLVLKSDKTIEEQFTCCFKIDMGNLTNFESSTQKSEKFALEWTAFDQRI